MKKRIKLLSGMMAGLVTAAAVITASAPVDALVSKLPLSVIEDNAIPVVYVRSTRMQRVTLPLTK